MLKGDCQVGFRDSIEYDMHHNAFCDDLWHRYDLQDELYRSSNSHIFFVVEKVTGIQRLLKAARIHEHIKFDMERVKQLHHKNLSQIIDYGSSERYVYILKEYVEGFDLESYIKQNGVMTEEEAITIIKQIGEALIYLHRQPEQTIVFRDLKPSNIVITPENDIKLIDLITIRQVNDESDTDTYYIGSPGYTAPEQYGFMQSTERSDVYSLGATFYFLITGKHPKNNLSQEIAHLQMVNKLTQKVLLKAIEFNPKERYESVEIFVKALDQVESKKRNSILIGLVSMVLVLGLIGISFQVGLNPLKLFGMTRESERVSSEGPVNEEFALEDSTDEFFAEEDYDEGSLGDVNWEGNEPEDKDSEDDTSEDKASEDKESEGEKVEQENSEEENTEKENSEQESLEQENLGQENDEGDILSEPSVDNVDQTRESTTEDDVANNEPDVVEETQNIEKETEGDTEVTDETEGDTEDQSDKTLSELIQEYKDSIQLENLMDLEHVTSYQLLGLSEILTKVDKTQLPIKDNESLLISVICSENPFDESNLLDIIYSAGLNGTGLAVYPETGFVSNLGLSNHLVVMLFDIKNQPIGYHVFNDILSAEQKEERFKSVNHAVQVFYDDYQVIHKIDYQIAREEFGNFTHVGIWSSQSPFDEDFIQSERVQDNIYQALYQSSGQINGYGEGEGYETTHWVIVLYNQNKVVGYYILNK
jgi:serine/threonine-protein kinase